jgi:UDP-N-acetylglucosamine 2-epimerase (non-hydrolysing)
LTEKFGNHQFILPVHPNPNGPDNIYIALGRLPNVLLTDPRDYPKLACIMRNMK